MKSTKCKIRLCIIQSITQLYITKVHEKTRNYLLSNVRCNICAFVHKYIEEYNRISMSSCSRLDNQSIFPNESKRISNFMLSYMRTRLSLRILSIYPADFTNPWTINLAYHGGLSSLLYRRLAWDLRVGESPIWD